MHGKEGPLEAHGHGPTRWVDAGAVRGLLSIGKTKSYDVIAEIERTSEEPDAVLRIGNLVRVRHDVLMRWIRDRGVAGGPAHPSTDGSDHDGVAPDAA